MKNTLLTTLITALFFLPASVGFAEDYKLGGLEISNLQARATLPGAPVSGGYMTIKNTGETADRLISASVDFAGKTEIHEMSVEDEIMKMRKLANGLEIPAGEEVVLKPGSYHIMFMKLGEQLNEGETRDAVLVFEKAGSIEVKLSVENIAKMKK